MKNNILQKLYTILTASQYTKFFSKPKPTNGTNKNKTNFLLTLLVANSRYYSKKNTITQVLTFPNALYKQTYKFCLICAINLCNLLNKIEFILYILVPPILFILIPFLLLDTYMWFLSPEIFNLYLLPNVTQILEYYQIPKQILIPLTNIMIPISAFFWILLIPGCAVTFHMPETENEQTTIENTLLYLLKIYAHDFVEDSQEENLDMITELELDFQHELSTPFAVFFFYIFWSHQMVEPYLDTRLFFIKKDNLDIDAFTLYNTESFYKIAPLPEKPTKKEHILAPDHYSHPINYEVQDIYDFNALRFDDEGVYGGENVLFYTIEMFSDYMESLSFTILPYYNILYIYGLWLFFFVFFFTTIIIIIIRPYRHYSSYVFYNKTTYNYYRPYLDQFFYISHRLIKHFPHKKQNFLLQDNYASQYLDFTTIIGDPKQTTGLETEGLLFRWFTQSLRSNSFFRLYDTVETYLSDHEEAPDYHQTTYDEHSIEPLVPQQNLKSTIRIVIECSLFLFLVINYIAPDQIFLCPIDLNIGLEGTYALQGGDAATRINMRNNTEITFCQVHLPWLLPTVEHLPWLLRTPNVSPLSWYLNWPGWHNTEYAPIEMVGFNELDILILIERNDLAYWYQLPEKRLELELNQHG